MIDVVCVDDPRDERIRVALTLTGGAV